MTLRRLAYHERFGDGQYSEYPGLAAEEYDDEDPSWSPPVVQEKRVGFWQRMLRAVMPSERD